MGDIFSQNKALIKRLYEDERKTLKQVKEILERDHQFPPAPLSIYETRLRNLLKLRKKFKKEDWSVIYHHHHRRNKKETALYLNGVKYPWEKAWKEIRRSGARETSIDQDTPLPRGIEVRTPSPSLPPTPPSLKAACPSIPPHLPTLNPTWSLQQAPFEGILTSNRGVSCEISLGSFADSLPARYNLGGTEIETIDIGASSSYTDFIPQLGAHSSSSHDDDAMLVFQNEVAALPANTNLSPHVKLMLEYLPWQDCRIIFYSMIAGRKVQREFQTTNGITFSLIPKDYFCTSDPGSALARMCDTAFPNTWDLEQTSADLTLASTEVEVYHFLAQAIYLLSNNLLHYGDVRSANLINALFFNTPRGTISALFKTDLVSIQAAWRDLLHKATSMISDKWNEYRQNWRHIDLIDVIRCIIKIGMRHPKWVISHGNDLVLAAISISDHEVLRQLLDGGACPARTPERTKAIFQATKFDSIRCIKVLVAQCDLNFQVEHSYSLFAKLLQDYSHYRAIFFCREKPSFCYTVFDIFLKAGADVYSPFIPSAEHLKLLEGIKTPKEWYPTCLDWSFLADEKLFNLFVAQSSPKDVTLTRHGVILAARQGGSHLTEYLRSMCPTLIARAKQFLEIIMREQFLSVDYGWHYFDGRVVKSLIDVGVQINPSDYSACYSQTLAHAQSGINEEILTIFDHLSQNGAIIGPDAFAEAVSEKGTILLELLARYGAEVSKIGGYALLRAARLHNVDAVAWLFKSGVDVNGNVKLPGRIVSRTIIGWLMSDSCFMCSGIKNILSMLQRLVDCGAELRMSVRDRYADGLMWHFFPFAEYASEDDHNAAFTWFLDQLGVGSRKIPKAELRALFIGALSKYSSPSWQHTRLNVFNRLYESYGLPPHPELIISLLIQCHDKHELIQEMIQSSSDINMDGAYGDDIDMDLCHYTPLQAAAEVCNYRLVLELISLGANVNAPARGSEGRTALQAICGWDPTSAEERDRQRDIVSLLITRGANINAAPARFGMTAIMGSAVSGNLELTAVLLAHGADPNNDYHYDFMGKHQETVLDMSTARCDIMNLLLHAGALGARRGSTGYEGTILEAEAREHHAVARMIRDHIAQQEELFRMNPELRACHRAVMKKMDDKDALGRE